MSRQLPARRSSSVPARRKQSTPVRRSSSKPPVQNTVPVRRKKRKVKRRVNKRNLWIVILVILICFEMIISAVGIAVLGSMLRGKPALVVDDFFSPESSHIYDRNGTLIADVGTQIRENITYNEISESVIDAFLAVEDSRFFEHDGFDLPRFT